MKSYIKAVNPTQLQAEVRELVNQRLAENEERLRKEVEDSVASQILAVTFWILHREEGWGARRMERLKNQIEDEFLMMHRGVFGRKYTPLDIRNALKERYGIDFNHSQFQGVEEIE